MAPVTNASMDPDNLGLILPALMVPGRPPPPNTPAYTYVIPWIPTARQPASGTSAAAQTALLTSDNPYYVGLSETVTISTTGNVPWQWRRVCFTFRGEQLVGDFVVDQVEQSPGKYYVQTFDNAVGVRRPMFDLASYYGEGENPSSTPQALQRLYGVLFQGSSSQFTSDAQNLDWINVMDAKTDKRRVTVAYDKTVTIASGNEGGTQRQYKRYHKMNKNLQYQNVESGQDLAFSLFSTAGKVGMGDYYVIDFFQPRYASQADDGNLIFDPRSTLYWHER